MNQLENCQARYRSNTWMGRTRTNGPDEFEPSKFDCILSMSHDQNVFHALLHKNYSKIFVSETNGSITFGRDMSH